MTKIIVDTNVIISALLKSKTCRSVLDFIESGGAEICMSEYVEKEYYNVISYTKFKHVSNFFPEASSLVIQLTKIAKYYTVTEKINLINDSPDNRLLELALVSSANFLITGNTNDFTFSSFFETRIISPADFCTEFNLKN